MHEVFLLTKLAKHSKNYSALFFIQSAYTFITFHPLLAALLLVTHHPTNHPCILPLSSNHGLIPTRWGWWGLSQWSSVERQENTLDRSKLCVCLWKCSQKQANWSFCKHVCILSIKKIIWKKLSHWSSAYLTTVSAPGWETFPWAALCHFAPPPPHSVLPLTVGRAPSTRPTNLHRYFLRKTYHPRLDQSVDYADAAANPAHNPPPASTSLSLRFLSLCFGFSFFLFTPSFPLLFISLYSLSLSNISLSYFLKTESFFEQRTGNNV